MKTFDRFRIAIVLVIVALFVMNFSGMFVRTIGIFGDPLEDLKHGYFVPFFSLYVIWRQRKEMLAACADMPSWVGALLCLPFLLLAWLGARGGQVRMEQLAFVGLCIALPYALCGRRMLRLVLFPAGFLLFCIPISSYLDFCTIYLRLFASAVATAVMNGFGVPVKQVGTALYSQSANHMFMIDVAEPCSGMRSLFAMMALSAGYAYFTQRTWLRRGVLFLCAVPIAVVGNIFRIMSICIVAATFGQDIAMGFYHDYSPFVIFGTGVLLLTVASDQLRRVADKYFPNARVDTEHDADEPSCVVSATPAMWLTVVVPVVLMAIVFTMRKTIPPPHFDENVAMPSVLPATLGSYMVSTPLYCQNEQCAQVQTLESLEASGLAVATCPDCACALKTRSLGESTILPDDTAIYKREYSTADGLRYTVSLVVGGRDRESIHRPELCLPAQGYTMSQPYTLTSNLPGVPPAVRVITVTRAPHPPTALVYWFFNSDGVTTCSHTRRVFEDAWQRSMCNRINRWVLVTVNVSEPVNTPKASDRFLKFLKELGQHVQLTAVVPKEEEN